MNVRAQISMMFHLDKCIGCHTCSISCKNIWTDRQGTEYMWWNNVETRPGAGYPTLWEDQKTYKGGWEKKNGSLRLKSMNKFLGFLNIFYNPNLPSLDDYYEPWSYRYEDLFNSPAGDDQPTARPISLVTGDYIDITGGPNWDDDFGGSPVYAKNDPNFENLDETVKQQLFETERLTFFYIPRICNHCLNPACVAACPSGAIYKRGEDGIVLVSQDICRAWRMCISACPYKKVYYNWDSGKAEKCILCFPRLETKQAQACAHSCVGRIRYVGVFLYDADKILETAKAEEKDLVDAQLNMILDPFDSQVIEAAKKNGVDDFWILSAQKSPVYKFVKLWKIALPLHPEFRTIPMMFYVPPLSPVMASIQKGRYEITLKEFFHSFDKVRVPLKYLANIFSAGDEQKIEKVLKKLLAVRIFRRYVTVGDVTQVEATKILNEANLTSKEAEAIFKLTSLPTFEERFSLPPYHRETALESLNDPYNNKAAAGFGSRLEPKRGW